MDEQTCQLKKDLGTIDTSLGFLLLILAATLLSFWSVVRQRQALCLTLAGETQAAARAGDVYHIRRVASALIVGSLGWFLCQAVEGVRRARAGGESVACRSAQTNLWASLLVLLAAVARLDDLDYVNSCAPPAQAEAAELDDLEPPL